MSKIAVAERPNHQLCVGDVVVYAYPGDRVGGIWTILKASIPDPGIDREVLLRVDWVKDAKQMIGREVPDTLRGGGTTKVVVPAIWAEAELEDPR